MTETDIQPYDPQVYDSRHIPQQPPQIRQHAGLLCMRLPWGNTQEVAPLTFIEDDCSGLLIPDTNLGENPRH
ncbi:hypothetical protein VLF92_06625 [Pseudomonas chengduensis]|jgi:hypothetical protein